MRAISDVLREPDRLVTRPSSWGPDREETRCITQPNGTMLCLTTEELAASGYREITGPDGRRVGQFGLCRDSVGEWVYPPLRQPDETTEQMLRRNAEAKARTEICKRPAAAKRFE